MAWRFDPLGHVAVEMDILAIKCGEARGQPRRLRARQQAWRAAEHDATPWQPKAIKTDREALKAAAMYWVQKRAIFIDGFQAPVLPFAAIIGR